MHFLFSHSLFYFLSSPFLVLSQLTPSSDHVDPNDPHISHLLVSHYDCSKQHNLRQFSLTRVQPCAQAPSAFESTCAIVNVFVRAKAKRLKAWTCEEVIFQRGTTLDLALLSGLNGFVVSIALLGCELAEKSAR